MSDQLPQPRIALVGEAHGADEEAASKKAGYPVPFVGASGRLLDAMLASAGIRRAECLLTNVLNLRPPNNDFEALLTSKANGVPGWPALQKGKYLPPALLPEVQRLHLELRDWRPDIIVTLGSKALWALCRVTGLRNRHGFIHQWTAWAPAEGAAPPIPVMPTWHPASVLHRYRQFVPALNDIRKARQLADGSWAPDRFIYNAEPTLAELQAFYDMVLATKPAALSVDIETKPEFRSITHIGFGVPDEAICCPFWDPSRLGQSYWATPEEERAALAICAALCAIAGLPKITQNGCYDMAWLWTNFGIVLTGPVWDIRLMHFGMFPELPHNLAEMASTWMMIPPWKALHQSGNKDGDAGAGSVESE